VAALAFYNIRSLDNALSVTGSAKTSVTSDSVKWIGSFQRVVTPSNLSLGYAQMAKDLVVVKKYYVDRGISSDKINISQVYMDEDWSKQNVGAGERDYILRQQVTITSDDVQKIHDLSQDITPIINQGVLFGTQSVEYYYSKLPDLRVSLLSDAVKDAKARAQSLALASGKSVGSLKSASSGVVQVLSPNSVDISDYGTYDTSSIQKDIMITVKASFSLK
jgi:hypothetical protein